jgi:transposase
MDMTGRMRFQRGSGAADLKCLQQLPQTHLSRDSPKESRIDLNVRAFSAFPQDRRADRRAGEPPVIASVAGRKKPRAHDRDLFAAHHLIDNLFGKLRQFRAIATRCDKLAINFLPPLSFGSMEHTLVKWVALRDRACEGRIVVIALGH